MYLNHGPLGALQELFRCVDLEIERTLGREAHEMGRLRAERLGGALAQL